MKITLIVAALIAIASHATAQPRGDIEENAERTRHQYWGFSVEPPHAPGWQLRRSEQQLVSALFRKSAPSFLLVGSLPSATHTFSVQASLSQLHPGETIEQFAERLRKGRSGEGGTRHELLSYEHQRDTHQGLACIRFRMKVLDKTAPTSPNAPLHMVERGFTCLHPGISLTAIVALTSERGLPSALNERLHKEGEHFLRSVQVESLPGVPVSLVKPKPHSQDIQIYRAEFGLFSPHGAGKPFFRPTTRVPLQVGESYGWMIQVGTEKSEVKWHEELTLPTPPQTWGKSERSRPSDDGKTIFTEGQSQPTFGLIWHWWRVTAGDPKGRYTIRVVLQGEVARTFEFNVE